MNGYLIEKYHKLIMDKHIYFQRVITEGDPFSKIPPKPKNITNKKLYFHADDLINEPNMLALSCSNYKKTKKIQCYKKSKTKSIKSNKQAHSSYLGINFAHAGQNIKDRTKEIKRNKQGDTIGRIIIGGTDMNASVSFINLEDVKRDDRNTIKNITRKIKKEIQDKL